jgi:hypothetical protein
MYDVLWFMYACTYTCVHIFMQPSVLANAKKKNLHCNTSMYVCMYIRVHVHTCMYACSLPLTNCSLQRYSVCMYVCMYVRMHVFMQPSVVSNNVKCWLHHASVYCNVWFCLQCCIVCVLMLCRASLNMFTKACVCERKNTTGGWESMHICHREKKRLPRCVRA